MSLSLLPKPNLSTLFESALLYSGIHCLRLASPSPSYWFDLLGATELVTQSVLIPLQSNLRSLRVISLEQKLKLDCLESFRGSWLPTG